MFCQGSAVCHVEQGIELLTAGHQGVKAAAFADLAVFQNENFIIFPQQRLLEPVCNDNTRQTLNGQNGGADGIGRGGVQRCRGLVDEQDGVCRSRQRAIEMRCRSPPERPEPPSPQI